MREVKQSTLILWELWDVSPGVSTSLGFWEPRAGTAALELAAHLAYSRWPPPSP